MNPVIPDSNPARDPFARSRQTRERRRHGRALSAWFALALAIPVAHAADGLSETWATVVAETRAAPAAGAATVTYLAVPVAPPVAVGGTLTAIDLNTVAAADDDWTGLDPIQKKPWMLEITSGAGAGWWSRVATFDSATQTAVLAFVPPPAVRTGDRYVLRRLGTIGEIFHGENATALDPAPTPSHADALILVDPDTHAQSTLFRSNVANHTGWHDATFTPAEQTPVLPGQAIILRRHSEAARTLAFSGVSRGTNLTLHIARGIGVVGAQTPGTGPTLATSGLIAAGFAGGADADTADLVILPQPDGSLWTLFYSTVSGDTGWRHADGTPAPDAALPADGAFLLNLRSAAGIDWRAPHSP